MADLRKLERVLKAAGNRRRLAILAYLKKDKEATVGELSEVLRLSFKATSKHLVVLYAVELLEREQRSTEMWYHLAPTRHAVIERLLQTL